MASLPLPTTGGGGCGGGSRGGPGREPPSWPPRSRVCFFGVDFAYWEFFARDGRLVERVHQGLRGLRGSDWSEPRCRSVGAMIGRLRSSLHAAPTGSETPGMPRRLRIGSPGPGDP